jgi:predicted phage baseplate assembly protein
MVMASHASEVVGEELGRSDGEPGQRFVLHNPPILPRRLVGAYRETVETQKDDGGFEEWTEVESFADSGPADSHFMVDELNGEVQFGPRLREPGGQERQYGRVPQKGRTIRFTRYRSGGGSIGNVGRGTLVVPPLVTVPLPEIAQRCAARVLPAKESKPAAQ